MANIWFWGMVFLVICQRIAELRLASINANWIRKQGGYEVGQKHYPLLVGIHTLFFFSLIFEVQFRNASPPSWWYLPFFLFLVAQGLRIACLRSLGPYWNTRIFVVPGSSPVSRGPYRFLRHPNYVVVITEILSLPLIFGAYGTAVLFSALNLLVLLGIRIPIEEEALGKATSYYQEMGDRRRLFPRIDRSNRSNS